MTRTLLAVVGVFVLSLLVVAATFRAAREAPAAFRLTNGTEPETLDPQRATGQPEGRVIWALFEGLTRYDERTLQPIPGAAESWDVADDGRRYVFHLRAGATWSDGSPLRAQDFAYAWRRLQDPALGSEYAYLLHGVRWAEERNTWSAQADALEGPVAAALAQLRGQSVAGVDAADWRAFAAAQGLADLCRGTPDSGLAARASEIGRASCRERV